jgi:hypothetical protein
MSKMATAKSNSIKLRVDAVRGLPLNVWHKMRGDLPMKMFGCKSRLTRAGQLQNLQEAMSNAELAVHRRRQPRNPSCLSGPPGWWHSQRRATRVTEL